MFENKSKYALPLLTTVVTMIYHLYNHKNNRSIGQYRLLEIDYYGTHSDDYPRSTLKDNTQQFSYIPNCFDFLSIEPLRRKSATHTPSQGDPLIRYMGTRKDTLR